MLLRDLSSLGDCRRVVDLEKRIWGYTDAEDVVPVPILMVTTMRGGILIGAFDGDEMVGFVYSLAGLRHGKPTQWSHMLGVLDPYRSTGLGHRLKLEQRSRALGMKIDLIEWTFDPLQALNAHFNFAKLGVVSSVYEENIYGESSSPLHRGTPTDRLIAEWWVGGAGGAGSVGGVGGVGSVGGVGNVGGVGGVGVNHPVAEGSWLGCGEMDLARTEPRLLLTIPTDFGKIQRNAPELARDWRDATRRLFTNYFARGYVAVDFVLNRGEGFGQYVLERALPN